MPSYLPFSQKHMYVLYMTMITFKTLSFNNYSQDFYNEDIKSLDLNKVKCTCGSTGHFHRHACYQRYLTIDANHTLLISIIRIKCDSCGCTHALLPSIIIPYRILSNPSIIRITKSYRNITDSCTVISKITGFSRETVNKIIRFYIRFHQERLNSFLSVFTVADFYDFDFILNYFYEYHAMFMQRISVNNMTIYP